MKATNPEQYEWGEKGNEIGRRESRARVVHDRAGSHFPRKWSPLLSHMGQRAPCEIILPPKGLEEKTYLLVKFHTPGAAGWHSG